MSEKINQISIVGNECPYKKCPLFQIKDSKCPYLNNFNAETKCPYLNDIKKNCPFSNKINQDNK